MSKNMTRKGLAFGAGFALVATGLAAMPAQGAVTGEVTMDPTEGTTYNSILESGITLESKFSPTIEDAADTGTPDHVTYLIENPSGASVTLEMDGTFDGSSFTAEAIDVELLEDRIVSGDSIAYATGDDADAPTTTDEFIYVRTASSNDTNRTALGITASGDKTVSLKVTAWNDDGAGVDGTASDGIIDTFEYASPTVDVVLYPAGSVPVTTKMSSATTRGADTVTATVELGNDVNPYMVKNGLGITFYKDGSNIDISGTTSTDLSDIDYGGVTSIDAKTEVVTFTGTATGSDFVTTSKLNAGIYTARALYHASNPDVFVGARSATLDLRDGTNSDVKGAEVIFTESENVAVDGSNNATIREETLSVDVTGQILDNSGEDLDDAGVRVRATVTGVTIDSDTEITVVGSSDVIDAAADDIAVFGFTDSDGQFPITINSNTGEDTDKVKVKFEALLDDGSYAITGGGEEDITWAEATLAQALVASPSSFLTGDTVNVTLTAVDQFGEGLDSTSNGRLSISVEAYINGAADSDEYSETLQTTDGSASFSFANFATAGSDQQIQVVVQGGNSDEFTQYFTVYNNVETSGITIADEFETRVQYVDYVTGSTKDAATLKAATDAGVIAEFNDTAGTDYADIVGTVLDANNAGQPGVAVTVSAEGVLFHDADTDTLAEDSITLVANAQGFFDVQALTQTAVPAGATVTITAGAVTETTLLKSYLATDIDSKNLVFDWTLPENIVMDTTYSVAVELKDVFGNPIRTLKTSDGGGLDVDALTLEADGSLQVNGVATIDRNFNSTGVATIFIRSVNEVAGPGQLRAILSDFDYYTGGPSAEDGQVDNVAASHLDVKSTSWDESEWNSGTIAVDIDVLESAADIPQSSDQKVNAGSFKGYVALYAKGYEGQRMSAIVAGKWLQVDSLDSDYERIVRFTGAGYDIKVRIYIDGEQVGPEFDILTK